MSRYGRIIQLGLILAIVATITVLAAPVAQAQLLCRRAHLERDLRPGFNVNEASRTDSQVVRDNHRDYVFFQKSFAESLQKEQSANAQFVKAAIDFTGWIPGDNHGGNYTVTLRKGELRYLFVDIKDGGVGPYFFSIANLVMNTHVVAREGGMKLKPVSRELLEAYLMGLRGEKRETPEIVKEALATDLAKYDRWRSEDAERFLNSRGKFKFKVGRIEPLESHFKNPEQIVKQLEEALSQFPEKLTLLDYGIRPKERGGSKDLRRIWAVVQNKDGSRQVIEFKQVEMPAAQVYQRSGLSIEDHTHAVIRSFWGENDASVQTVWIDSNLFVMRPRKIELLSIPYKQKNPQEREQLLAMTTHAAYQNGLHQRAQDNGRDYAKFVQDNFETFDKALRKFIKAYYGHLKIKMEDE